MVTTAWECRSLSFVVGVPVSGRSGVRAFRCQGVPVSGRSGVRTFRRQDVPASGRSGVRTFRCQGVPVSGRSGVRAFRCQDVPASGRSGVRAFRCQDVPASGRSGVRASWCPGVVVRRSLAGGRGQVFVGDGLGHGDDGGAVFEAQAVPDAGDGMSSRVGIRRRGPVVSRPVSRGSPRQFEGVLGQFLGSAVASALTHDLGRVARVRVVAARQGQVRDRSRDAAVPVAVEVDGHEPPVSDGHLPEVGFRVLRMSNNGYRASWSWP